MFSLWVAYWQVRRTYRLLAKPMEELVTVTTPGHKLPVPARGFHYHRKYSRFVAGNQ